VLSGGHNGKRKKTKAKKGKERIHTKNEGNGKRRQGIKKVKKEWRRDAIWTSKDYGSSTNRKRIEEL